MVKGVIRLVFINPAVLVNSSCLCVKETENTVTAYSTSLMLKARRVLESTSTAIHLGGLKKLGAGSSQACHQQGWLQLVANLNRAGEFANMAVGLHKGKQAKTKVISFKPLFWLSL